jgi:hypothetical protein
MNKSKRQIQKNNQIFKVNLSSKFLFNSAIKTMSQQMQAAILCTRMPNNVLYTPTSDPTSPATTTTTCILPSSLSIPMYQSVPRSMLHGLLLEMGQQHGEALK